MSGEDMLRTLYDSGCKGVSFGDKGNDTALFTLEDIEWLIKAGFVEKTGEHEYDRTFWRLNKVGLALTEAYFSMFECNTVPPPIDFDILLHF